MKRKTSFLWLLPLLLFLIFPKNVLCNGSSSSYKQQVIIILDSDATTHKTGKLLHQQHDTVSHVLMWNGTLQTFKPAQWSPDKVKYQVIQESDIDQYQLPIGPQKSFSWKDTLIQVVGLGDVSKEQTPKISGLSAEELAVLITVNLTNSNVGRINIIGYSPLGFRPTSQDAPAYLNQFMYELKRLRRFGTSATLRFTLVMMDHSGRILGGELLLSGPNETGIDWRKGSHYDMWVGFFIYGDYQLEQVNVPVGTENLNSRFFGILPEEMQVYVTDYQKEIPSSNHQYSTYIVTDEGAFNWVDKIAQETYKAISKGRASSISRQIQLLSGDQEVIEVTTIEMTSALDFLKEVRHYHYWE